MSSVMIAFTVTGSPRRAVVWSTQTENNVGGVVSCFASSWVRLITAFSSTENVVRKWCALFLARSLTHIERSSYSPAPHHSGIVSIAP